MKKQNKREEYKILKEEKDKKREKSRLKEKMSNNIGK